MLLRRYLIYIWQLTVFFSKYLSLLLNRSLTAGVSENPLKSKANQQYTIMLEWYLKVVRDNYANFEGRARRSEFWYFTLVNFIVAVILSIIASIAGFVIYLYYIYALAVLVPSIAVGIRRLHDLGKSGWFYLLAFVPLVNIYILVLFCTEGDRGSNEFGPDPKGLLHDEFNDIGKPDVY
jgi:uncharacterized membrane protein YhaH (DUF805 family)